MLLNPFIQCISLKHKIYFSGSKQYSIGYFIWSCIKIIVLIDFSTYLEIVGFMNNQLKYFILSNILFLYLFIILYELYTSYMTYYCLSFLYSSY